MTLVPIRKRLDEAARGRRLAALRKLGEPCRLCPRACGAMRFAGEPGLCGGRESANAAYWGPHHGEEPPLSGTKGAGNLFFTGCSVGCVFCQNHQISRPEGVVGTSAMSVEQLADRYLEIQAAGCHNLNWVTATHQLLFAVEALFEADRRGFRLPLLFNSGGYESVETLEILDGIVDVYLPDFKYGPKSPTEVLCQVEDYCWTAELAIREMHRQVGPLRTDEKNIAVRGLVVRHLVLPGGLADTGGVLALLSDLLPGGGVLSLMAQYTPLAPSLRPPLDRILSPDEYDEAVRLVDVFGFDEGWVQELESRECYLPDFSRADPFYDSRAREAG